MNQSHPSYAKNTNDFCPRCGRESLPCHCGHMLEFDHVETLDRLDSALGLSLFRMKRFGQAKASFDFMRFGVVPLVERAEELVETHSVQKLIVVPMSRQSYFGPNEHPNEWILKGLQARAENQSSPLHRFRKNIHFGIHAGLSRSASKRTEHSRGQSYMSVESKPNSMGKVRWRPELGPRPFQDNAHEGSAGGLLVIDDVLTSGHSASRCATLIDPERTYTWLCLGVARAIRKRIH